MSKTIVIQPGGYHPYHAGHHALYQSAQRTFPDAEVFVAATNDTSSRPFPFAVKEKLAKLAGVETGHFVQVKSPFRAEEITSRFDPQRDVLIFVRSEKDAGSQPQPGGVKRDGSPSYLQPLLGAEKLEPFSKHAYMAYLPTVEFGPGMTSATQIRTAWPTLDERRKTALVMSLYPVTQKNPQLAATVVKLLDAAIGTESVTEGGFFDLDKPNPGDMVKHRNGAMGKVMKISTQDDETWVYFKDKNGVVNYGQWKKHVFPVKEQGVEENKIQYGVLDKDNVDLIIDKAQGKADGIYSFRGIMFKVKNGGVTHWAVDGKILQGMGRFNTQVGSYEPGRNSQARAMLKSIKETAVLGSLNEFAPSDGDDGENPLDDYPCYDCGSTIYMHHTRLCDLAEPNAVRDLPAEPGTQYWTGRVPKGLKPIPGLSKGVEETVSANGTIANTSGAGAGMTASYQRRENQPVNEDYLDERRL